ncbi:MAG: 1-acyl-sn-glycerol-3-phosphate acyltransferase [Rhodanobacter sp.]|nr:1-acyl-sn-glycerol-3-phosphate acyltransferase [Rhodanobacter sp.]
MNESQHPPIDQTGNDPWRVPRYLLRAPLLVVHGITAGLIAIFILNPFVADIRIGSTTLDKLAVNWWSGGLLRICGFRVRRFGEPLSGAVLYVANHISWLDIVLLQSQRRMNLIAKSEIARWPYIGWLAARSGTIFHRRGSTDSLAAVMSRIVERLRSGKAVGVFPEGGSGRGPRIGTFHARIFQTALDAGVPVQPVALRYGRDGRQDPRVPFGVTEGFFTNFLRIIGGPPLDAEIHFLDPVPAMPDARRRMAEESRARIVRALGYSDD